MTTTFDIERKRKQGKRQSGYGFTYNTWQRAHIVCIIYVYMKRVRTDNRPVSILRI